MLSDYNQKKSEVKLHYFAPVFTLSELSFMRYDDLIQIQSCFSSCTKKFNNTPNITASVTPEMDNKAAPPKPKTSMVFSHNNIFGVVEVNLILNQYFKTFKI